MMWLTLGGSIAVAGFGTWAYQIGRERLRAIQEVIHHGPVTMRRDVINEVDVCWSCDERTALDEDDLGLCDQCRGRLLPADEM